MDTELNLPPFEALIKEKEGQSVIFDTIRRKYVALTPEEWVRQHFINFLIAYKGFPNGLMAVEQKVTINRMSQRVDIVAYNRKGKPILVVECKVPDVKLTQATIGQAARYNLQLQAGYLIITNGKKHFCCRINLQNSEYEVLQRIPDYQELVEE
ncbi:MAG TPA: type I restriction enzyme HsdR N-terminal domain-containing protein [Tenuifilaceae bacterium]|nr:type I restriction enzyme HsdR N-terminal domain-containing protein [Tenuifilaceae bacterium]HQC66261.1 type I restriction enzyme HsdR N-terminal domain-containing protein [Tenuifilaceae bacterium]